MNCPKCKGQTAVVDSKPTATGVRRRRKCLWCDHRFSTLETQENFYAHSQRQEWKAFLNYLITVIREEVDRY